MTGMLFQTIEMLVPMAVKASVRWSSSMGTANVLTAKENAAKRPPTAVPTASIPQPCGVVRSIATTPSRPGNGLSPKKSA
jgi:hypothetical protein